MKMKKLVSLLTALALSASMAVIPAMAEGEFTPLTVTELPMGTTASFLPVSLDAATAKKADVNNIAADDRTLSTATVYGAGDYIAIYPTSTKAGVIDGGDATFDTRKYVARLKLATGAEFDTNGAPIAGMFSVTPAEAGALIVDFSHPSGTPTDERTIYAYQDGAEFSKTAVVNSTNSKVSYVIENVAAHKPVYIYCKEEGKGLNYHGVTLTDTVPTVEEPEPDPVPDKLQKDVNVTFDTQKDISKTEKYNATTVVYSTGDTITVDGSNKTIDGRVYTTRMKFGSAKLDASGIPTSRAFSIVPAADGILKVDFAATNKTDAKSLTAIQQGSESVTENVLADGTATLSMSVKADVPVYVYSTVGANVYGYILIDASAEIVPGKMPINTTVTFESGVGTSYSEKTLFGDYVLVMPKGGDTDKTKIDSSSKTIPEGGTKYTATLKLGGKGSRTERAVEIIPAAAGTLRVPFVHSSSTEGAANAVLKAYQDGQVVGSQEVAQDAANGAVLEAEVAADKPVYIYSEQEGSNIYAIILAKDLVPEKLQPGANIIFDSGYDAETSTGTTFSEAAIFEDNVLVIPDAGGKTQIAKSGKTIGDVKYTTTLKLGGTGSTTSRAIEVIPAAAGTLKIPFVHASSTEGAANAVLKAYQDGQVIGSAEVAQGNDTSNVLEVNVEADKPVYIYSETQGANIYAVIFDSSAPADPEIYEITATYSGNALTNVTWAKVKTSEAQADEKTAEKMVAHWKNITGTGAMEPVVITATTPATTD